MKPRIKGFRRFVARPNIVASVQIQSLPVLIPPTLQKFQSSYFNPSLPCVFPPRHFSFLPAISTWFIPHEFLRNSQIIDIVTFRSLLGERLDLLVPLESTSADNKIFTQTSLPFTVFLDYLNLSNVPPGVPSLYLAQEPLLQSFPQLSKYLLPVPEYIEKAGKGDLYSTRLWMGRAGQTNTPLHKDPNPNLFVQLAGRKRARLFSPEFGKVLMGNYSGSGAERKFRTGDEMMVGKEKEDLEAAVWSENSESGKIEGFETELGTGDGLFIPKGWWHAVKGVGEGGVNASVIPFQILCSLAGYRSRLTH